MKAANKFYIIKALGLEKETSGGIIIQCSDETELAEVVSYGPDVEKPFPEGAKLAVNWQGVTPIIHKGERFFVIHADNILASLD